MQYQILVQSQDQNGYLASVLGMPECVGEASTKDEAVAKAKAALLEKLAQVEIVTVEMEAPPYQRQSNPLLKHAGRFKDDPTFDDFLAEVERYRRELDAEESNR